MEPCGAPPPPQLGLGGFLFDEYQRIALEERFKFWDLIFTNPSADPRDMPPYLLFNDAELAVRTLLFGGTTPGNPSLRRSGSDDQRAQLRTLFDRYEKAEYLPDQLRRAYFLYFNMAIHWLKAMSPYLDNLIFMSNISTPLTDFDEPSQRRYIKYLEFLGAVHCRPVRRRRQLQIPLSMLASTYVNSNTNTQQLQYFTGLR